MSKGTIGTFKHPGGAPTLYDPKTVIPATIKYLESRVDGYEKLIIESGTAGKGKKKKKVQFTENKFRVRIPTVEGLAVALNVHKDTLQEWKKIHPEFSVLMAKLLQIQAARLVENGLSGTYNPTITKVLLTKHGYREGLEHTGEGGESLFKPSDKEKSDADRALGDM